MNANFSVFYCCFIHTALAPSIQQAIPIIALAGWSRMGHTERESLTINFCNISKGWVGVRITTRYLLPSSSSSSSSSHLVRINDHFLFIASMPEGHSYEALPRDYYCKTLSVEAGTFQVRFQVINSKLGPLESKQLSLLTLIFIRPRPGPFLDYFRSFCRSLRAVWPDFAIFCTLGNF